MYAKFIYLLWSAAFLSHASPEKLTIYFDSDRTSHYESARSIEMGVKTAFDEVDNKLNNIPIQFIELDHRGNVVRSKRNMGIYGKDPSAVALFAGLHSPPLIKYREYINQENLLILNPWAAGAPITRYPSPDNFIFRLSVDDKKVGSKLVDYALNDGCTKLDLLLESTPWGQSNALNMSNAIKQHAEVESETHWFNWGINDANARIIASDLEKTKSQCILFVGNSIEGSKLIDALSQLESPPKVYSHWGITGGSFPKIVSLDAQKKVALRFIQSCFNFYSSPPSSTSLNVFERAQRLFPDDITSAHIAAPAGFVHGYDLALLFINAAKNVELTDDAQTNRVLLKEALENMQKPVNGLLKKYTSPYSQFSESNQDAHEALNKDDLCMAQYASSGAIKILPNE